MIIAYKSGLMIACRLIKETESYWYVQAVDEKKPRKIDKRNNKIKCFPNGVYDAEKWIKEGVEK